MLLSLATNSTHFERWALFTRRSLFNSHVETDQARNLKKMEWLEFHQLRA